MSRVVLLRGLQQGLSGASRRLVETVDRFKDEHEFSLVGATAVTPTQASLPSKVGMALPDSMQAPSPWASFSDLELDRYDDFNVLSRGLTEITSDVSEMNAELVRELAGFADDSDAFSTLVSGIQTEVTRARMIGLEVLFTRIRLPARDAAEREGKELRVLTFGEEVSLDKTIADALFTPMLHLVRNAVVHGVESPATRIGAGKPAQGVITLGAREEAGQIVIEVQDDGAGLDLVALRAKGVAMGLVPEGTPLSDPAITELVFASGLTTRASASDVSGRGIGGDVIRRSIERMNGSIRVETAAGRGTTFTLSLPVTLSITRALLVQQKGRALAVPLHFSERIIDVQDVPVIDSAGMRRVRIDDVYLPVWSLDEVFGGSRSDTTGPLLILRVGRQRICLQVDKVQTQEEIVVKSMGELLNGHPLFAGATIRGNGELVLILDVPALIEGRTATSRSAGVAPERSTPELGRPALAASPDARSPRLESLPQGRAPRAVGKPVAGAGQGARLRVLFVDDSLSVRRVAEKALQSLGAEVTLAVDGVDALAKLQGGSFDIVFTDLEMPRIHGYDLIRELRFIPAFKKLPIVVVSSRSGQKHQEQARALGANEYMTKPFSAKGLESALQRWCSEARGTHAFHESPESV